MVETATTKSTTDAKDDPRYGEMVKRGSELRERGKAFLGIVQTAKDRVAAIDDYLVPVDGVDISADGTGIHATLGDAGRFKSFGLTQLATRQFGARVGVNGKHVSDLMNTKEGWGTDLLAATLDVYASHNTKIDRMLFRTINDKVAGVLSDKYRRLDTGIIFSAFQQQADSMDMFISGGNATDTQMWIEAMLPTIRKVPTAYNGDAWITFGCRLSNSEFGAGALSFQAFETRIECFNLMSTKSMIKAVHLGKQIPSNNDISRRTAELDSLTQASQIVDYMQGTFTPSRIDDRCDAIKFAGEAQLPSTAIERLPKLGLTDAECGLVSDMLVMADPNVVPGGPLTRWSLGNAVSAAANKSSQKRRVIDLQNLAGDIVSGIASLN